MIVAKGLVEKSLGRGRKLGFPTANIALGDAVVEDGIYIGFANKMPALIFVGAAETFGERERRIEAHLLDFDGDLYGQEIEVELKQKIRESRKFETQEELVAQMKKDEQVARKYFST
ncbi:MAG: riboflavin kinase [Candidatus Doudnabacteria bacterium]|nr:riboflavin kinase [Candidatus Doudnabacteria bacterium]